MSRRDKRWFANALHFASSKTYALNMLAFDTIALLVMSLMVGGVTFLRTAGEDPVRRGLAVFVAFCAANATLVILRSIVPFLLRLSFANMIRLRLSFFIWMTSLVLLITLVPPIGRLFASCSVESVQMTLILATMAFVVRYFQTGALWRLAAAFTCAGAALGISAVGVLASVAIWRLVRKMANGIFAPDEGYGWRDEPKAAVSEFFTNPIIRSRMKWIFFLFFLVGLAVAFWRVFLPDGHLPGLKALGVGWMSGLNLSGGIVLLAMILLPLFIVINRVAHVSDANTPLSVSEMMPYIVIGAVSVLFLVKPQVVSSALGLALGVDDRIKVLAVLTGGFNILASAMILLIDIRCRDYEIVGGRSDVFLGQMRFTYVLASVAPVLLAGAVMFLALRRDGSLPFRLGVEPPAESLEVEMALSPREAMRIAVERKNHVLAERYARQVIVELPGDLEANGVLVRCYAEKGGLEAAESLVDRVLDAAPESLETLDFALGAYETCGNTNKAANVRERIEAARLKAN